MKRLICCCCGAVILGWQHWNRDTGFGICKACSSRFPKDYPFHTEGQKPTVPPQPEGDLKISEKSG